MSRPVFLTAYWRHLIMLNYRADPELLRPYVPAGVCLDFEGGETFVSLVGFHFGKTRVLGIPVPGHGNFEEFNLRFYVRCETAGEVRRGVSFISEIVPRRAIAWVANWAYNERYAAHPMRHVDSIGADGGQVEYGWHVGPQWGLSALESAARRSHWWQGAMNNSLPSTTGATLRNGTAARSSTR